jgi:hypothetical protein
LDFVSRPLEKYQLTSQRQNVIASFFTYQRTIYNDRNFCANLTKTDILVFLILGTVYKMTAASTPIYPNEPPQKKGENPLPNSNWLRRLARTSRSVSADWAARCSLAQASHSADVMLL